MKNANETVEIEIATSDRLRLNNQIVSGMEALGHKAYDFKSLELGFELPCGWPIDMNAQPTMAQLVVLAAKLKMRIIISDLNLVPRKEQTGDKSQDEQE